MVPPKEGELNIDEPKDEPKKEETTMESLKDMIVGQNEIIEALKTDSSNEKAQMLQTIQEKYNLMDSDMKNLTNLIGGLANPEPTGDEVIDDGLGVSTDKVKEIADKRYADNKKTDDDAAKKELKDYYNDYSEEVQGLMGEDGPDGKPLSKEAKEGIKKLLIETVIDKSKNPTRDAHKNFKKATKIFFGLDRANPFKGGKLEGTGSGGGDEDNKGKNKRTFKITDESRKFLKDIGESEESGQEKLNERANGQLV